MAGEALQTVYCWEERFFDLRACFASSQKGAVMMGITLSDDFEDSVTYFGDLLPGKKLLRNRDNNALLIRAVEAALNNRKQPQVPLDVACTNFQMEVWKTIAEIPYGTTRTYSEVARMVGRPLAARAVGQAMGQNPLPLLFP